MALTEERVLASVKVNQITKTVDVEWQDLIKRDGEVISRSYFNTAYSESDKERFLAEVERATDYLQPLGWS